MVLSKAVLDEMRFWEQNVRRLNGQRIRREAGVQVLQPRMLYSDAGVTWQEAACLSTGS